MWNLSNIGGRQARAEPPPRYPEDGPIRLNPRAARSAVPPKRERAPEARLSATANERDALAARLSRLERMLADPELGENAILYFRLRALWAACHDELEAMAARLVARHGRQIGQGADLTLARRRAINTTLIAAAQEFFLDYREEQIADMAREAMSKPVDGTTFGLAEDCLRWQDRARELAARARERQGRRQRLRERARYLYGRLQFDKGGSVPRAGSLNSLAIHIPSGEASLSESPEPPLPVNVLALDYWGLREVLLP